MQRKDQTREIIVINILEEIKIFKGTKYPKETSYLLNASYVTIWDILQEIVHSKQNNSRREIGSSMPEKLKLMTYTKKRITKMKTSLNIMF